MNIVKNNVGLFFIAAFVLFFQLDCSKENNSSEQKADGTEKIEDKKPAEEKKPETTGNVIHNHYNITQQQQETKQPGGLFSVNNLYLAGTLGYYAYQYWPEISEYLPGFLVSKKPRIENGEISLPDDGSVKLRFVDVAGLSHAKS